MCNRTLSLFETNPNLVADDPDALKAIIRRYERPWEQEKSASPLPTLLASIFGLEEDHSVIQTLLDNPVEPIHQHDLFLSGDKEQPVVFARILSIRNRDALGRALESMDDTVDAPSQFIRELRFFVEDEEHTFVAESVLLVGEQVSTKNVMIGTPGHFKAIPRSEHDFNIPVSYYWLESAGVDVEIGGMHFSENVKSTVAKVNAVAQNEYQGEINFEWLLAQPLFIVENTIAFMYEVLSDSREMLKETETSS